MRLLVLFLITFLTAHIHAEAHSIGCDSCEQKIQEQWVSFNADTVNQATEEELIDLADKICSQMIAVHNTGAAPAYQPFESYTLEYLGITKETPNYRAQITDFWNKNKNALVCTGNAIGYKAPQHLYKRAIAMGAVSPLYFDYFLKDGKGGINTEVDVNAVEYVDGKPETVIDYLDRILENPELKKLYNVQKLKQLRGFLTTFVGAKKAEDLEDI